LASNIESLKARIQGEENKSIKISLEAQLRAKESEMEGYARKLRDFEERKDGIGHA
jgi:hypothetical protein